MPTVSVDVGISRYVERTSTKIRNCVNLIDTDELDQLFSKFQSSV